VNIPLRSVAHDNESAERWHTEFWKTEHPDIGSSDLANLFLRATAPLMSKFVPLNLSMADENQLDNAYNVSLCLDELKTTLLRFDMLDVFTILFPTDPNSSKDNSVTKKISLFDNFLSVTVEDFVLQIAITDVMEKNIIYRILIGHCNSCCALAMMNYETEC